MNNKSNWGILKIVAVLIILGVISSLAGYYVDWLWFQSVNFAGVFTTTLLNQMTLTVGVFIISFLFFWLNLWLTGKNELPQKDRPDQSAEGRDVIYLNPEITNWARLFQGKMPNGHSYL